MLNSLDAENGRMAVVLPHGVLFRGASEGTIRKQLIDLNLLDAVIGLPANLFYGTGIPACILVFKKNWRNQDVFFIDASGEENFEKGKTRTSCETATSTGSSAPMSSGKMWYAYKASRDEIKENDYNLNMPLVRIACKFKWRRDIMRLKVQKFYNSHPKYRKFCLLISDTVDKLTLFHLILLTLIVIAVPSVLIYHVLPEDVREILSALLGGLLSLVVIPLVINWYNNSINQRHELIKGNLQLYIELGEILIGILESTADDTKEHPKQLSRYIVINQAKINLLFDTKILWNLADVKNELHLNSLNNAKIPCKKILSQLRKQVGLRESPFVSPPNLLYLETDLSSSQTQPKTMAEKDRR